MRPNIVLVMPDQHRASVLGCYGDPVVMTPNVDRLASEAVVYDRAYCQSPVCMPSRASILTGLYVRDHGCRMNNVNFPSPPLPTLLTRLSDAGYRTAAIGKMHFYDERKAALERAHVEDYAELAEAFGLQQSIETPDKLALGSIRSPYSEAVGEEIASAIRRYTRAMVSGEIPVYDARSPFAQGDLYIDTWVGANAAEWIRHFDDTRPFFLWVGFPGPHHPFDGPDAFMYPLADLPEPDLAAGEGPLAPMEAGMRAYSSSHELDQEKVRTLTARYYANVSAIDEQVGAIIEALREQGLWENTWLVYTSDHGEMLGTRRLLTKVVFYEPSLRVPLVIRQPGGAAPRRSDALVELTDVVATILDVAGADPIVESPGHSLFADDPPRRAVFSEIMEYACVVTNRWKYARRVMSPGHDDADRNVFRAYEAKSVADGHASLHDLRDDPRELFNLAADPLYASTVEELETLWLGPFLAGERPA